MSDVATGAPAPAAPAAAPAATTTMMTAPAAAAPAAPAATGESTPAAKDEANTPAGKTGDEGGDVAKTPEQIEADRVAAEKGDKKADDKAAGAPEKYEDFKAPEGRVLDPAVMTKFVEAARALDLPQDKAQQLVDQMAPVMAARQAEQLEQFSNEWATASKADKEFGGEKLAENMVHAKRALDTFATPELRTILDETKLGNHPELVRFMVRAGKAISEDKVVVGGTMGSTNRSAADVLYGGTKAK